MSFMSLWIVAVLPRRNGRMPFSPDRSAVRL
jgi:hypothetical protein